MTAYYNEFDLYAAQWLRNLIAEGHIAAGDVDDRSIKDVTPADVKSYTQCHFFAGIGGWSAALQLAGWPADRPVWTGSCPCQPFSAAGQRKGTADERHLWPEFRRLIAVCSPPIVFGEQVASSDGRQWLAGVRADLEELAYAVGVADLCAAGVAAPHIRQRLWWVADADMPEPDGQPSGGQQSVYNGDAGVTGGLGDATGEQARNAGFAWRQSDADSRMANTIHAGLQGRLHGGKDEERQDQHGHTGRHGAAGWADFDIIPCADGKSRRIESRTFPLAHGIRNRMDKLRAYGNAIVPQVAAEFIKAADRRLAVTTDKSFELEQWL